MTDLSTRSRITVALGLILLGVFLSLNSRISDSALDMLPDKAVRGDLLLLQQLGMIDRVLITLTVDGQVGDPQSRLTRSIEQVGEALARSGQFETLLYHLPSGYETSLFTVLQPRLPLLLDQDDLSTLARKTSDDGLKKSLGHAFGLLNSLAGIGLKKQIQQDPLGITPLLLEKLKHLKSGFSMEIRDGFFLSRDGRSGLLIGTSALRLTNGEAASKMQKLIDTILEKDLEPGVTARIIGTLPHTLANMNSIRHDLRVLMPLATLLLLALLLFGLLSIRALVVLAVPFLAAPLAIGVTSLTHGQIGGLALGFGIVLLGIAVDFAIHLYLALRYEDGTRKQIMARIRQPILLATMTTTSVFLVLLFSQVPSHQQMATLALTGILLAVLLSYLLIPLVVSNRAGLSPAIPLYSVPDNHPQKALTVPLFLLWLLFLATGVFCWNHLDYKGDLRALDVADQSIIDDEQVFRTLWEQKGEQGFLIAQGQTLEEALEKNSAIYSTLARLPGLRFQSIGPVLPSVAAQKKNLVGWQTFWHSQGPSFTNRFTTIATEQGFTADGFGPFFTWITSQPEPLTAAQLLDSPLRPLVTSMVKKIEITDREDDLFLVTTSVDTSTSFRQPLLQLDQHPGITLIANWKWRDQVETLMRHDILTLSSGAGLVILLIITVTFKRFRPVVAVLAPVLSALASMAVFSYVKGAELNMMHLLMGIMVIGLSVDYGIFIVCSRSRSGPSVSFTGVSICAASSLIGFGVLSLAQHPALNALGLTVLMGIGAAWPTALWITPLILGSAMTAQRVERP